jgi:hypothetical protein
MNSLITNRIITILLLLIIIVLVCVIIFYPVGKDRCMKSAKNSKNNSVWCVNATQKPTGDGSCQTTEGFRIRKYKSNTRENWKSINPRFRPFRGGFKESIGMNINNLDFLSNTMNHNKITRQMKVLCPEFSWNPTGKSGGSNDINERVHQRFSRDISRFGYDDTGKLYGLICPQSGSDTILGTLCAEVRVQEVRGFVDEEAIVDSSKGDWIKGDIKVTGHVWFENSDITKPNRFLAQLMNLAQSAGLNSLPINKESSIKIPTYNGHGANNKGVAAGVSNRYLRIVPGYNPTYTPPPFTLHEDDSTSPEEGGQMAASCYLVARLGEIDTTGLTPRGVKIQQLILDVFNDTVGNMLKPGNDLAWNINVDAPESVDINEYKAHSEFWRRSLGDIRSTSHEGESQLRHKNGNVFTPPGFSVVALGRRLLQI